MTAPPPPPGSVPPPPAYVPGGYAPGGYPYSYPYGTYAPPPPRGLAIASMVTGIVGVFFSFSYGLGFLPSLAAVITGHLARKRQPYARGMSLSGLICGYIGLGISVLWIIGIVIFIVWAAAHPDGLTSGYSGNFGTNT